MWFRNYRGTEGMPPLKKMRESSVFTRFSLKFFLQNPQVSCLQENQVQGFRSTLKFRKHRRIFLADYCRIFPDPTAEQFYQYQSDLLFLGTCGRCALVSPVSPYWPTWNKQQNVMRGRCSSGALVPFEFSQVVYKKSQTASFFLSLCWNRCRLAGGVKSGKGRLG